MDAIRQLLTRFGEMAAHPGAFGILLIYALLWFIFDRDLECVVYDFADPASRTSRHAGFAGKT